MAGHGRGRPTRLARRAATARSEASSDASASTGVPSTAVATTVPASTSTTMASSISVGDEFDERGRALAQVGGRQRAMPLVHGLREHVLQGATPAPHGIGGHANLLRDAIGREEPDATDVARQAVRILGEHLDRIGAVGPVDAHGAARADAMRVQEHHDLAHGALALPVLHDAARADAADPRDVQQAIGLAIDDVEDPGAEGVHQLSGQVRPDALDQPGPEVALDALGRVGRRDANPGRP